MEWDWEQGRTHWAQGRAIEQDIDIVDAAINEETHRCNPGIYNTQNIGVILVLNVAILFGSDLIHTSTNEYDSETRHTSFRDVKRMAKWLRVVQRARVITPRRRGLIHYTFAHWLMPLDVESKWYTGYVTNVDFKTNHINPPRRLGWQIYEWFDPHSGKLAPDRTRAIVGRFQEGLPKRPVLPVAPQGLYNDRAVYMNR